MKQEKNYTLRVANGRATLILKKNYRSASCEFPLFLEVENEKTHTRELKKQTRTQVEKYLLKVLAEN